MAEISLNEKTGARLARVERDGEDFSASINSINLTETQNIVKILKEMGNQNRNFDTLHQTNSGKVFRMNLRLFAKLNFKNSSEDIFETKI